jgi:3-hydroxyacyl-CoA dehydrogenase
MPGFVVNRILTSTAAEIWRYQDETGIGAEELDEHIKATPACRWARSGSPTVGAGHRAQGRARMRAATATASTSTRAWRERVQRGELGAKSGKGFYEHA